MKRRVLFIAITLLYRNIAPLIREFVSNRIFSPVLPVQLKPGQLHKEKSNRCAGDLPFSLPRAFS